MGGATGEAFVNTLLGTGMTPAGVLAREAIQNSVDALKPKSKQKVRVIFRRQDLTGKPKAEFIRTLGLANQFVKRKDDLELQLKHCLGHLNDLSVPLQLLYVDDYGTHGLYGNPHQNDSHFFRLLLSLGDGSKSRTRAGSGGSYGYGKSVYSANSRIHTIVAYSAFDPKDDGSKHHARLMGCGYFRNHDYRAESYTGRAWFGYLANAAHEIVDPLHDDDAHQIASSLGFAPRTVAKSGTSILIIDCGVTCDELRSSVEEWWWPRIIDDSLGLDVELVDNGINVAPPRPRSRADLRPFIHCFELAVGRTQPVGKHERVSLIPPWNGHVDLGSSGFALVDQKPGEENILEDKLGTVALVRGPRMVVAYMDVGSVSLPCVGAFVGADAVEIPLKISEPAAHDKWDPKSSRLLNLADDKRSQVKAVIDRIKAAMRRFAADATPAEAKEEARLKVLERLLGSIFKPPTRAGERSTGGKQDPIEIEFIKNPKVVATGGALRTEGEFSVALADDAAKRAVDINVEVECRVVEYDGVSSEDPVETFVETKCQDAARVDGKTNCFQLRLTAGASPRFKFKTAGYKPDWTTQLRVVAKENV